MIEQIKNVLIALKILGVEKRLKELENRPMPLSSGGGGGLSQEEADQLYLTPAQADTDYVNVTGDTMTGDLEFPATGFIMASAGGLRARVTMDENYALVTTPIVVSGTTGSPYGLLLILTQPS